MKPFAGRLQGISPSQTVAIDSRFKAMKAAGLDVLSLGAGEPDFPTPAPAAEAGIRSIREGKTRYTAPTGLPELKTAIADKLRRDQGLEYRMEEITVSSGAKHAVFNTLLALLDPGDEVIIPAPYWVTYPELVKLLGAVPVVVETRPEAGFRLSVTDLKKAITARTKLLILNSPNNPTGAVYPREELEALAGVLVAEGLYCLSDEIYEKLVYGGARHHSIAACHPGMRDLTVVVNGLSKAHAMTGWRIGYSAAEASLAQAIATLQSQCTHHPANASQYAAIAALKAEDGHVEAMRREFEKRRAYLRGRLEALPGLAPFLPDGAFYFWVEIRSLFGGRVRSSLQFCEYLLAEEGLAAIPGTAFGCEGYVRLAYAASREELERAMDRFEKAVRALEADRGAN